MPSPDKGVWFKHHRLAIFWIVSVEGMAFVFLMTFLMLGWGAFVLIMHWSLFTAFVGWAPILVLMLVTLVLRSDLWPERRAK
jgi:hypothetical protein